MKPHCKIGKAATLAATLFVASAAVAPVDRALAANENSVTNYSLNAAGERRPTGSFFPKRGEYELRRNITITPSNPGYGQSFGQWFINEGFAQNPRLNTVGIVSGGLFVAANALYGGAVVLPSVLSNAAAANAAAMARMPVTAIEVSGPWGGPQTAAQMGLQQIGGTTGVVTKEGVYIVAGVDKWMTAGQAVQMGYTQVTSNVYMRFPAAVVALLAKEAGANDQTSSQPGLRLDPLAHDTTLDRRSPGSNMPGVIRDSADRATAGNPQPGGQRQAGQNQSQAPNAGSPISAANAQPIGGAGVQREPVKFDPRFDIWNNARGSASLSPSFGGGLGGGPNVFRNDIWGRGSSSGGSGSNAAALALLTMAQETVHSAQKSYNACMNNPKTCGGWTPPYTADQLQKQANLATKGAGSNSTITGPGSGSNKIMTPVLQPDGTFKYIDSGSSGRPVSGPAGAKVGGKSTSPSATGTSPAAKSAPASTTSNVRPAAVSGTSQPAPGAGTVAAKRVPSIRNPAPTPNVKTASPQLRTASPQLRTASPQLRTASPQLRVPTPQVRVPTPQVRVPTPNVRVPTPQLPVVRVPTPQLPVVRVPQVRVHIR